MSNGESKIAESKAALCCGFAIALRALFLGILQEATYLSLRASVRTRGNQPCAKLKSWGILCLLIASLTLTMTQNSACKILHCHVER